MNPGRQEAGAGTDLHTGLKVLLHKAPVLNQSLIKDTGMRVSETGITPAAGIKKIAILVINEVDDVLKAVLNLQLFD